MGVAVAAAGNALGTMAGNALLRQGKTPQDVIRETEKQAIENSRRDLTNANNKAIAQLQAGLQRAQQSYSSVIEMGNRAYTAFNETLGLTQTVGQKQQVLQNVLAGKSQVKDLANLFPGLDTDMVQKQLFTPKQIQQSYNMKVAWFGGTDAKGNKSLLDFDTYMRAIQKGQLYTPGGMTNEQYFNSKAQNLTQTRMIADPNFQAPNEATLQKYITDQALAKGQLDPFDARSPLEKYQATAQFGLSQEQIASAQNVLSRKAAGSGMLQSGNFARALAAEGVKLGNEGFINYQNQLLNSAGQGLQASGQLNQVAQGYDQGLASLFRQQGVDNANLNFMNASSREKWIQGKPGYDGGMGIGLAGSGGPSSTSGRTF